MIRNPYSIRPYQHVLEPVMAYLVIAEAQYGDKSYEGAYNIGPDEINCWTTESLVNLFCEKWMQRVGKKVEWINRNDGGPYEAGYLKLDCSRLKRTLSWKPCWSMEQAMEKIVEWSDAYLRNSDVISCMEKQIKEYFLEMKKNMYNEGNT